MVEQILINLKLIGDKIKNPAQGGVLYLYGAAGRIRTSDRLVRSQVLYPAELQPLKTCGRLIDGAAGRIRTSDRLVRSQVLYPAELQPHIDHLLWLNATSTCLAFPERKMAEREGFEPSVRLLVRFLSRELVSATHPPLLENGAYTTIIFLFS